MDARLTRRDAAGHTIGARFTEEQRLFRLAQLPFAAEATTLATPRALVRLEGAMYSVLTRWAGLDLVVRVRSAGPVARAPCVAFLRRSDLNG
jgi:hypothetical protein